MFAPTDTSNWSTPDNTEHLLGRTESGRAPLPDTWWRECLQRTQNLRNSLHKDFIGLSDQIDWLLAVIIARENGLLLGAPGVAKSQITTRLFELLDLKTPPKPSEEILSMLSKGGDIWRLWEDRAALERGNAQKYFHYLLSRFTQPEELFGPIEIELLRKGLLVRVNFGLLTGPGVRAGFLDEIFKASSSILNTLLTLTQERRYFNWGGMENSDLLFLIGASNELPGAFGAVGGVAGTPDDFQQLHAFLDRFPLRLLIPVSSGSSAPDPLKSDLARAFDVAIRREANQFSCGTAFSVREPEMPSINDVICLGRSMLEAERDGGGTIYERASVQKFRAKFVATGCRLQADGTDASVGRLHWTISPRKLRSLYKISLAHALVTCNGFVFDSSVYVPLGAEQLRVFSWIWDSPVVKNELQRIVDQVVKNY